MYNTANRQQLFLYEDPESGSAMWNIAEKFSLETQSLYSSFTIAIGDVILGLVPQEKLPELLVERLGVSRPNAMRITADVLDFLAPLDTPTTEPALASTPSSEVKVNPVKINTAADNTLANEIAEAEAAMSSLEPLRTMSHDMEVVRSAPQPDPTHTAPSQADLLDRSATTKDKNPDARWGTEQA